ncbi:DUF6708 domain-containing protein [Herbaspirillum seropedicae]|uniref:DUF6708 domain-containing protein n=1 Tax=Herbaspirillum seropedicae TaxID=964 RepID=UPI002855927D|nr:DUF6708 domain-containing protein [Herbaspirillum seropedicae]MDR6396904.1 hypothetical protein [Herbaspirillum seropedicae]
MTTSKESRFHPQNPLWYEDLVPRSATIADDQHFNGACFNEDVDVVDGNYLEISRESSFMRGSGVLIGFIMFSLYARVFLDDFRNPRSSLFQSDFLGLFMSCVVIATVIATFKLVYLDVRLPRDIPVRFNRKTQKIYVYDYLKPKYWFNLWRTEIKVYDWNCVEAELTKMAGYTGKAYVVRHELVLVICRPGTNEVIDRIFLKGLDPTVAVLYEMWTGVRRFMKDGLEAVPGLESKIRERGFFYSLLAYMPYFLPGATGRRYRQRMRWYDYVLAFVSVWFFWIWLPLGLCHYLAITCAPEPRWPTEIDAESRSLRSA